MDAKKILKSKQIHAYTKYMYIMYIQMHIIIPFRYMVQCPQSMHKQPTEENLLPTPNRSHQVYTV